VTYASGGPGYILSSSALSLIAEKGLGSDGLCHFPHPVGTEVSVMPSEDLQLGACAAILNITLLHSMDSKQRSRFLPFRLERHLVAGLNHRWWKEHSLECGSDAWKTTWKKKSEERTGFDCVSPDLIGMHYVRPEEMYSLQFLLKQRDNLANP